jgi:hypothetical protein
VNRPKTSSNSNSIKIQFDICEFCPDGANYFSLAEGSIGQIGEKVGGPFSKEGMIGSQFDASKSGIAGTVEKMVGGPRNDGLGKS